MLDAIRESIREGIVAAFSEIGQMIMEALKHLAKNGIEALQVGAVMMIAFGCISIMIRKDKEKYSNYMLYGFVAYVMLTVLGVRL